jgi:asparagine synthase (glutamine-hydrolysing)
MCGIVGIVSQHPVADRRALTAGSDAIAHRGPDDSGEWWSPDGRAGLGHRRLAIIDLSPGGHQPMSDPTGQLTIVFNGEIYNHQSLRTELQAMGHAFRSRSDTEVILASYRQWGENCLSRLNGMFAIALFDAAKQRLFLARDRAGEKPLFYSESGGTLRFASELKALMADPAFPRRVNAESLDCYLAMGFVPDDRCILEGAKKLPPAHALTFCLNTGETTVRRYWEAPEYRPSGMDDTGLLEELELLLADSVSRQLVADVPVGILLSGGVDSSLVTAMAVRSAERVKTFTIRFPGYDAYDETEHARLIARHFRTEHVELTAPESTVDLLPKLAAQFDEPMADSSMIPTFLVSRLIREHCTVALGGDGGDELFGGYVNYGRLLWARDRIRFMPRALRAAVASAAEHLLPVGFRGRNWLLGLSSDWRAGLPAIWPFFDRTSRARLMSGSLPIRQSAEAIWSRRVPSSPDMLYRATRMDFENYLPEDILVKVDRASMLNSLEIRAPLLDHRIIEFAFGKVPSKLKSTTSARKILLKRLCQRVLPPEFDHHRKQGFSIPLGQWLKKGPWMDRFHEVLLGSSDGPFDKRFIRGLLAAQARGRANGERLFALTLFELWRQAYGVSI